MRNIKKIAFLLMSMLIALSLFACSGPVKDKQVTVSFQGKEYEGLYTGEFSKGQPSGTGVFTYSEKDVVMLTYEGEFEEGKMKGSGTLDFSFFTLIFQEEELIVQYKGGAVDGLPSGNGTVTYEKEDDRLNYEGELTDGKMTGKGTLDTSFLKVQDKDIPDAGQYKGDVVDGIPNGEGELAAVNSEGKEFTYTGSWKDGLFNGQGSKIWKYTGYAANQAGNFTDGTFNPTLYEYLMSYENDPDFTYTVTEKAKDFLNKQETLFPVDNLKKIASFVDESVDLKKWIKNPDGFGDKIIKITGPVTDIRQVNNKKWTLIVIYDWAWDHNVTVFYPGKLKISEGDKITVYGLPLASGDYENILGKRTDTYVMAGSFIKK